MRCGCPLCGAFMVQRDEGTSECVCPSCGYRCDACLGTGTALSREEILRRKDTDWYALSPADARKEVQDNP